MLNSWASVPLSDMAVLDVNTWQHQSHLSQWFLLCSVCSRGRSVSEGSLPSLQVLGDIELKCSGGQDPDSNTWQ